LPLRDGDYSRVLSKFGEKVTGQLRGGEGLARGKRPFRDQRVERLVRAGTHDDIGEASPVCVGANGLLLADRNPDVADRPRRAREYDRYNDRPRRHKRCLPLDLHTARCWRRGSGRRDHYERSYERRDEGMNLPFITSPSPQMQQASLSPVEGLSKPQAGRRLGPSVVVPGRRAEIPLPPGQGRRGGRG
jgi:hypothetical protein